MRAFRTALDALAFSSVWLAAAAGALCAASSLAMGFPPALPVVAIACAGTLVVYTVDPAVVRPQQRVGELKIVRRIGEDEIDGSFRKPRQLLDAIAHDDFVAGKPKPPRVPHTHVTHSLYANTESARLFRAGSAHAGGVR